MKKIDSSPRTPLPLRLGFIDIILFFVGVGVGLRVVLRLALALALALAFAFTSALQRECLDKLVECSICGRFKRFIYIGMKSMLHGVF
jgi:hypothetical protein